jgi:peroxiredoxin
VHIIPIGPLMLNFGLVTFILSSVIAYFTVRYRLRTTNTHANISDKFLTALILGFFIWKFSLLLFDPITVIRYPMSLLYFNGGDKGLWLGIIISLLYVWKSSRKEEASLWVNIDVLITSLVAGSVPYNAMLLTLDNTNKLLHCVYICLAISILILINSNKQPFINPNVIKQIVARRNGIAMIVVLTFVISGVYYAFSEQNEVSSEKRVMAEMNIGIKEGNLAPDFELMDLNGKLVKRSDYEGKKVILNFWATWCPPCRVEMPQMVKIHEDYEQEVVVLAVNLTNTEKSQSDVRSYVERSKLPFPVGLDAEGEVSETYQIIAYPTSFIIDTQGIIQEVFQGAINYEIMKKAISSIR